MTRMKRLVLALTLIGTLVLPSPVSAATSTYSGRSSLHQPFSTLVATSVAGDLTASISYTAGNNAKAVIRVLRRLDDGSFLTACVTYGGGGQQTIGCVVAGAPANTYRVEFWPNNGWANFSLTVQTAD